MREELKSNGEAWWGDVEERTVWKFAGERMIESGYILGRF